MRSNISPLLLRLKSLDLLNGGMALDVGTGAGGDSIFLVENGYKVIAIDKDTSNFLKHDKNIDLVEVDINEFKLNEDSYDIIIASNSLPFVPGNKINTLIGSLVSSLRIDGFFCFTLFGREDEWFGKEKSMNFMTYDESQEMIGKLPLEVIFQSTEKGLGKTMKGNIKFWQVHKFIVKKIKR